MTQITINEIQITSNQCWVSINGISDCLGLYEASVLLKHSEDKKIKIISRQHNKQLHPNETQQWQNYFMIQVYRLLDNTNHLVMPFDIRTKDNTVLRSFWIIDEIVRTEPDKQHMQIEITIRNLKGEKIKDD